ncbi:hypothetical protein VY88_10485 [Azospirillum thiophilum]|uniref:Response regulatory domain-containing protein n=1 Tax=Azospirillum thiophilum TaxID=528244 RepID=A0AAC8VV80_9PROT|nr:hypothetical protein [Azospirillum thiophilum]ALG69932.1 hypothetical protein AL072_02225 [Azospirillum thiophilum]KJR66382.1 hypothetical protein VY88_10485 [Azospirillum thiophilum]
MPAITGNTVVVLEQNAILRLGVEALLESWGCRVIAGDCVDDIIAIMRDKGLRPTLLLLPPTDGLDTGDRLGDRFEAEMGHPLPWIGITADPNLLQHWKAGASGGILLEMPCSPDMLRTAMLEALRKTP